MFSNAITKTFIPTVKPAAARTFYRDILGLTFLSEDDYGMEFNAHGTLLRVITVPTLKPQIFTVLGWNVSDIEDSIKQLNEKGVYCEKYNFDFMRQDDLGIWVSPSGARVAWFKDVDGNVLSLTQL
ncbi:VOC family protein [Mucilaginibacter corticis]|uniref:VOC family protein n=1 Tax=Mucilaginibacter corticis TaxID=2597670 RepID=A0A556MWR2_9SPHI|nr:VOC family protein [Mucilaginibacter corticis]TSJ44313.1 VOC family protein [Mucilaginibacter corticis]